MHWILVGILIFTGFAIAPLVIVFGLFLIPGIIGGTLGLFLSIAICSHCQDPVAAMLLCTGGGIIAPYLLMCADELRRSHALCTVGLAWTMSAAFSGPALTQSYEAYSRKCDDAGNPDQTIIACSVVITRGLAEKEDMAAAFKNRGNAYNEKGQYDLAIADYDHAIAINSNDADAFNNRGTTYSAIRKYDLAIQDYDQALKLRPNSAMALNNRCFAMAVTGKPEQGLTDCNESLRLRPGNASALASRGFAYLKLNRYQAAIADYDIALQTIPSDPYLLFGRGMAKLMKGDLRDGDGDLVAAEAIMPAIVDEMAKLGVQRQSLR